MHSEITDKHTCQGIHQDLFCCSQQFKLNRFYKVYWRCRLIIIHSLWHLKDKCIWALLCQRWRRLLRKQHSNPQEGVIDYHTTPQPQEECLSLRPGEWVEVKSEAQILATLDKNGKYKGLYWMCNMRKFCGKRYRVYKRLERMLLECTGEYRKIKNTVLLEEVFCDGEEWYGCDRTCFHFWREVWLKRVEGPK